MDRLVVKNFAQIDTAEINFGDLTVLVGPQATGKSLLLQLLKFSIDRPNIALRLKRNGVLWDTRKDSQVLATFLGEGYESVVTSRTSIELNGKQVVKTGASRSSVRPPRVFFIPAQRVLTFAHGWPKAFGEYGPGDPYVVREFSQEIFEQFGRGLGSGEAIFPQRDRLKAPLRRAIEKSIFHGGTLALKKAGAQRKLVIRYPSRQPNGPIAELPFLEWSAGQREFAPLLLGLYGLLPAGKVAKHTDYRWAVIEEPEMGLHPKATNAVMLMVFELLARGYKVCLSTHSSYVLELVWALRILSRSTSPRRFSAVLDALDAKDPALKSMAKALLKKTYSISALTFDDAGGHRCTDISTLDFDSANDIVAGWGGITSLSSILSSAVARGV